MRLEGQLDDLKRQLLRRLEEQAGPSPAPGLAAPTLGARAALETDMEAAARTVLAEAGGRRARAKHLLRQRLNGGSLNGSEAAYWRQLGALSLLDSTEEALKAYGRAADLAPEDPEAQMLAGLLHMRAGQLDAAEAAFRRQMALAAARENGATRHRAGTMLGDVLAAKGDLDQALAAYREAQQEAERLAQSAPQDADHLRDLSLTHDRIGDVLFAKGRLDEALESFKGSLAVTQALAKRDPSNPEWQRDLSVTHDRIGELLERNGDVEGALASCRQGLAIAEALARRDRGRADWQWDLSFSLDRMGDVLLAAGRAAEALAAYRRGLKIAEEVASRDTARTAWQRDLAATYHKVGLLEATQGDTTEALELLERGRAIIARLDEIAAHRAQWRYDLRNFDQALATLRS